MIPDSETLKLPLLRVASDGEIWTVQAKERLQAEFGMTEADKRARAPGAEVTRFTEVFERAVSELEALGLLKETRQGFYTTTESGLAAALSGALPTDTSGDTFEGAGCVDLSGGENAPGHQQSPLEVLRRAHQEAMALVATELLRKMQAAPIVVFKELIARLLQKMGYGQGEKPTALLRAVDSMSVEGVIGQDPMGALRLYVRALRLPLDTNIEAGEIEDTRQAMERTGASGGIVLTTSGVSRAAAVEAETFGKSVVLLDGRELARKMIEHGIGCSGVSRFDVPQLDEGAFG